MDSTGESPIVNTLESIQVYDDIDLFEGIDLFLDKLFNSSYKLWVEVLPSEVQDVTTKVTRSLIRASRNAMEVDLVINSYVDCSGNVRQVKIGSISDISNMFARSPISTPVFDLVDFHKDNNGVFHVTRRCWQAGGGYNNFYDFAFDSFTSMNRGKFKFGRGDDKFTLWMWKGDYFNLGAGGEIGIYKGKDWHVDCYTQSKLKMNLDIRLKDGTQVIDWDADDLHQWWITGFNPDKRFQDVKTEDLVMVGMVDFDEERVMWKEFVHTAEFDDQNEDKINDNWCLDLVHRNAVIKWERGNIN